VSCDPQELRPHSSYARHGLSVSACKLASLRARGEQAFLEHIPITRDRIIIDGYAHWELAKELKRPILHCIEYDLSETEALEWLLQRYRRSTGLNDYARIILALDLEPELTEIARANKQIGGQQKGLSNLTKAGQVHVRSEIARAAGVSAGNVTKVKQLNQTCADELKKALSNDEISIHWAWKLREECPEDQLNALGRLRFEGGLRRDIRQMAVSRSKRHNLIPQTANEIVSRLDDLGREELQGIRMTVLKGLKPEIFITEALARKIGLEQFRLWNQSAFYQNSPQQPKSFGLKKESERRSGNIMLDAQAPTVPGVYAFVVDDLVVYVGLTLNGLRTRFDQYRRGHEGQRTSARINERIAATLGIGKRVKVLIATPEPLEWQELPVNTAAGLEAGLIEMIRPSWNIKYQRSTLRILRPRVKTRKRAGS
jgi:hypothetical protein